MHRKGQATMMQVTPCHSGNNGARATDEYPPSNRHSKRDSPQLMFDGKTHNWQGITSAAMLTQCPCL
jgi:hypothetical protein